MKNVPFLGGVVGGTFDAYYCRLVGRNAKNLFYREPGFDTQDEDGIA